MLYIPPQDKHRILEVIKTGTPREVTRAHALNMRSKGLSSIEISEFLELTPRTVFNICSAYEEHGVERALVDDPRPGRPLEFDARFEAQVVATVCSDPPEGFDRWTLVLLKERLVEKGIVESVSLEKLRVILREHDLKPWQQRMWCIPKLNDEFIERMEDVLDVYSKAYDEERPVVCIDEKPVMLHGELREPVPMSKGHPKKVDYEYKRNGTANIFAGVEPKTGRYFNKVTATRTGPEYCQFLREIADAYPQAEKIILAQDNLSTHTRTSLTKCLGEHEGNALWERFEVHYTPKHGSWLNQAEIAIGMYQRQCLGGTRIPDIETLEKKTTRWNSAINQRSTTIEWKFSTDDARHKFKYSTISEQNSV